MICEIKWRMFFEVCVRITLWFLFIYFDAADPFIREIKENEVWQYQYPVTSSYVPSPLLWLIMLFTPFMISFTECLFTGKREDPKNLLLGITLSYGLTGFITAYLKILVGRPRPDFYYRCFPDGKGNDYHHCTGKRKSYLDGRKSFPSGHASFAFACMLFISIYLGRKLNLFREKKTPSWRLVVCILPLLISAAIAISRTCDYHHHYEDVVAGSLLGSVMTYLCYQLYFPKVVSLAAPP